MKKIFISVLFFLIPTMMFTNISDAQIEYAFAQKMQLDTIRVLEADENNRVVIEELHFQDLLPTMNQYSRDYYAEFNAQLSALRLVEVQRDRLQYLYEKKQESIIKSLMPNPLAIATVTFSTRNLLSSIIAVAGTALSSINSYASQADVIELEYIQQNWELDDQETLALDALSTNLYLYKCDIGSSLGIERNQALSSDDLRSFVRACNESSPSVRYSRLSRMESRLNSLPDYWREMATAAYELKHYDECLSYLSRYEEHYVPVFFHDNNHASAMMIKAYCILENDTTTDRLANLVTVAEEILENIQDEDWTRYMFCAGLFEELYSETGDLTYARKAYDCYYSVLYSKITEFKAEVSDYASLSYIKKGLDVINAELERATSELEYAKSEKKDNAPWLWSSNKNYYNENVDIAQAKVDEIEAKRDNFESSAYYELPPDDSYVISIFGKLTSLAEDLDIKEEISYLSAYDMIDEVLFNVYSRNAVFGEEIPVYDCTLEYEHNTVFSDKIYVEIPLYQLQFLGGEGYNSSSYDFLINGSNRIVLTINNKPFNIYPYLYIYNSGSGNIENVFVVLYAEGIKRFEVDFTKDTPIQSMTLDIESSCFAPLDEAGADINSWDIPQSLSAFKGISDNIKYSDAFLGIF